MGCGGLRFTAGLGAAVAGTTAASPVVNDEVATGTGGIKSPANRETSEAIHTLNLADT